MNWKSINWNKPALYLSNSNFESRHIHGHPNQIVFREYISDILNKAEDTRFQIASKLQKDGVQH
ncbi:hypothetical protein D2V08_16290 [Flagellimonas lutimaris]|uniref:Uncharacterized protein n=1 Tax=Flagellimonas lutimaris TaxID=475082 RepID=A0A3A1N5T0_9FLAO|nr:hypothetical protein D2V08_16290 [Allomuricauda lutimaris]